MPSKPRLMATLFPSNPHFARFANDARFSGLRLNHPLASLSEIEECLARIANLPATVPLWYDVKGRQLRVMESIRHNDHLELLLNHAIDVATPTFVGFKAGRDRGVLANVADNGRRLIVTLERSDSGDVIGPKYIVHPGESLHIKDPSLTIREPLFTELEIQKIERLRRGGFTRWFLSYAESQRDIDRFVELVGRDAEVMIKIESKKGLDFVRSGRFEKRPGHRLVAARGDLHVEVAHPRLLPRALETVINEDHEAVAGSRMLLSIIPDRQSVPDPEASAADFSELAWLYAIGYREMLLCDDICVKPELLERAANEFHDFYAAYC